MGFSGLTVNTLRDSGFMGHNHSAPVPPVHSVQPGDTMQILYRASQDIGNDTALYQFKPVHAPRGLIHDSNQKYPYTPSRFSGLLNGALTTFAMTEVQVEDEIYSYCLSAFIHFSFCLCWGGSTKVAYGIVFRWSYHGSFSYLILNIRTPTTLLCLINNFYPDQVTLSWTMDGKGVSGDQQDSQSVRIPDRTYSTSSTLTLPRSTWESGEMYVCQVQH
uniref:Ig-like domain-containing protein n=1 Tax=Hucho hucho TaxID=62062 RepID=A0A4W5JD07_9TELE